MVYMKKKFTKQRFYETGPRAMRIRKQQGKNTIYKIKNPKTQKVCSKSEDIQHVFESYYKDLYTQPAMADITTIESFLSSLDLPSIGEQQNKEIMNDITAEELNKAISRLTANKAPGSDGYLSEWYKTFWLQITPVLRNCFNHTLRTGEAHQSWKEVVISILPKERNDKMECSSYRPISVLTETINYLLQSYLRDWKSLSLNW